MGKSYLTLNLFATRTNYLDIEIVSAYVSFSRVYGHHLTIRLPVVSAVVTSLLHSSLPYE